MTFIPLAQNWTEMQVMIASHLSRTPVPRSKAGQALRAKIEATASEAPVPMAMNRLAQAIYDAGDAADDAVKTIGVALMGGLALMGTGRLGGLREDLAAMRLVLMRELGIKLPVGVSYPASDSDPARGAAA